VFASKIADLRSSSRISCPQLDKYQVFLGMMINFWVDFEVTDNRVNDLIVSTVAPDPAALVQASVQLVLEMSALTYRSRFTQLRSCGRTF
jgi:hypothetical protein